MKWLLRGIAATAVIVGFATLLGHFPLVLAVALFGVWFTVAWVRLESRPVSVDE